MAKGDSGGGGYMPGLYQASVNQTGKDYDSIMNQYQQLTNQAKNNPSGNNSLSSSQFNNQPANFSPISPSLTNHQNANYQAGPDFSYLQNMVDTGGFSEADKGNIRARDTAATSSIYDSAQRGLSRQKALSGGYSPNFGAASAKMAREASNQISKINTDSNANIAEMVQRGKLAGMNTLAPLQANANQQQNQFNLANTAGSNQANLFNANATNSANQFNAQMPLQYGNFNLQQQQQQNQQGNNNFNNILQGIQGQQSLYGTTPALANTFGNQVLNAANTTNSFPPVQRGGSVMNGRSWGRG